jgi:hypothetical protein
MAPRQESHASGHPTQSVTSTKSNEDPSRQTQTREDLCSWGLGVHEVATLCPDVCQPLKQSQVKLQVLWPISGASEDW